MLGKLVNGWTWVCDRCGAYVFSTQPIDPDVCPCCGRAADPDDGVMTHDFIVVEDEGPPPRGWIGVPFGRRVLCEFVEAEEEG